MRKSLADHVRQRAEHRCEYCRLPTEASYLPFEIDHIVPKQHGGRSSSHNFAYACFYCNRFKGPDLSGVDPRDGTVVRLFDPRVGDWDEHFQWDGPVLRGRTPVGRATIATLKINLVERVAIRRLLGS